VKQFFTTLPRNLIACFQGRMILWHLLAIVLTLILVQSGFDGFYFRITNQPTLRAWMFPSAPIGGLIPLLLPLGLIFFGNFTKNPKITLSGWVIGQAALAGSLISSAYKTVTGRAHPVYTGNTDISHTFHFGWLRGGVFWGWPSSHTTIAFAMAVAVMKLFPERKPLGLIALAYALYIGLGVSMNIHWFSDFAAGVILGTLIGTVVGKSFNTSISTSHPRN
jgi:membrane-associated phospholipid phosphatase